MIGLRDGLNRLAEFTAYSILNLEEDQWYTEALLYFIPMVILLCLLLVIVVYIMAAITRFISYEKIREYLERRRNTGTGNFMASAFGAITPFCECSSVPIFVGMMQAGIPLGIALSFLITSPLVNEMAIAVFWVTYGWQVTVIYVLTGMLLGVAGGILLDKMGMARHLAGWVQQLSSKHATAQHPSTGRKKKWGDIHNEASGTIRRLLPYVFIGIAIGAIIHGYVPDAFFEETIAADNPLAVPVAVILGIPMYIDAVTILPVIESLVEKGVPLGTAIAFMMGSIGLSFPQAILLKQVMKKELIFAFFVTIGLGMILAGFLFNMMM